MPMTDEDLAELKANVGVARKRPMNFGLCMGKAPETTVLVMHRMKDPQVLARQAKKDGDTSKICYGEANVKGKKMSLTCFGDIPAGIAKRTKGFLAGVGLNLKVVMLDQTGNVGDDDGEEEELEDGAEETEADDTGTGGEAKTTADSSGSETETDKPADPMAANWAKLEASFRALVDKFVAAGSDKAQQVRVSWDGARRLAEAGRFADAIGIATRLKPILTAPPVDTAAQTQPETKPDTNTDPAAAKWDALFTAMSALFEKAMKLKPANRTQLEAAWAIAQEKAEDGDYAGAMNVAARLRPALDAVISAGPVGEKETDVIPPDVVPFQRARVLWVGTRQKMFDEMAKLENAIISACAGDEELQPIADEARDLSKRLAVFDDRLHTTLDAITTSAAGPARETLKKQAMGELREYAKALGEDFFKDVDSGNGFVPVSVAAAAKASLAAIAKTLS